MAKDPTLTLSKELGIKFLEAKKLLFECEKDLAALDPAPSSASESGNEETTRSSYSDSNSEYEETADNNSDRLLERARELFYSKSKHDQCAMKYKACNFATMAHREQLRRRHSARQVQTLVGEAIASLESIPRQVGDKAATVAPSPTSSRPSSPALLSSIHRRSSTGGGLCSSPSNSSSTSSCTFTAATTEKARKLAEEMYSARRKVEARRKRSKLLGDSLHHSSMHSSRSFSSQVSSVASEESSLASFASLNANDTATKDIISEGHQPLEDKMMKLSVDEDQDVASASASSIAIGSQSTRDRRSHRLEEGHDENSGYAVIRF